MAAVPRAPAPRRRRSALDRPVNARTYRGSWLLVAIPLLIAAFSVGHVTALPRSGLPPTFDGATASRLAAELARLHPDRRPGTPQAAAAARWLSQQLRRQGYRPSSDRFTARIPGEGRVELDNVSASAPGRSPDAIVVMAHRDNLGTGPGANDNASGTAALLELARAYAAPPVSPAPSRTRRLAPAHTMIFLSTDGGAFGGIGAERFVETAPARTRVASVINLDSLAGRARARVLFAGESPGAAAAELVDTAAARIAEQSGAAPRRPSAFAQLLDLAFPFTFYEHAVFVERGIPAVTLTTARDRPPAPLTDTPDRLNGTLLAQLGRAAQQLLGSLDQGLEVEPGRSAYLYLGSRIVRGWALEIVLIAALLPFLVAAVDLFARCRRHGIPLAPAIRSYRTRLGFVLWLAAVFALFALAGIWPDGGARPPAPGTHAAGDWPVLAVTALAVLAAAGWLVARGRLLPWREIRDDEELAGQTAALLALGIVALVVAAVNPFALIFVLPSLHAWVWLPNLRTAPAWVRLAVLALGLAGPLVLVTAFATRYELGFDTPWYLAQLVAQGHVPLPLVLAFLAWLAAAAQLAALAGGRYAPYPSAAERPAPGPLRNTARRLALLGAGRRRPVAHDEEAGASRGEGTGRELRRGARLRRARRG